MLGLLLARAGVRLLHGARPENLPRLDAVAVDPIVLAFAVAAALGHRGLCAAWCPALRASRTDVMEVLRAAGGRSAASAAAARSAAASW